MENAYQDIKADMEGRISSIRLRILDMEARLDAMKEELSALESAVGDIVPEEPVSDEIALEDPVSGRIRLPVILFRRSLPLMKLSRKRLPLMELLRKRLPPCMISSGCLPSRMYMPGKKHGGQTCRGLLWMIYGMHSL